MTLVGPEFRRLCTTRPLPDPHPKELSSLPDLPEPPQGTSKAGVGGMGPGGQRPGPSVQLRHSCCLGELRHKIARSRQVAFTPKPSSGSSSQTHTPSQRPQQTLSSSQTPRSHISPLYSPACPLQANVTSCWLCLLNRLHIHTTVPIPRLNVPASFTWKLASSAPPLPFVLHNKQSSQNTSLTMSFPCLISDGPPLPLGQFLQLS